MIYLTIGMINIVFIMLIIFNKKLRYKLIEKIKEKSKKYNKHCIYLYFLVFCIFTTVLVFDSLLYVLQANHPITRVERPSFGEANQEISLDVYGMYGKEKAKEVLDFTITAKKPKEKQLLEALSRAKKRVEQRMLGENQSLGEVQYPLNLPLSDKETGVEISWESGSNDFLRETGFVATAFLNQPRPVSLKAIFRLQEMSIEESYEMVLVPNQEKTHRQESLEQRLSFAGESLKNSSPHEDIILPKSLNGGIDLKWTLHKNGHGILLIFLWVVGVFVVYQYGKIQEKRKKEKRKTEIIYAFPDFISKLVMMLNAGLVIHQAMEKIVIEYEKKDKQPEAMVLYELLSNVHLHMKESNTSLVKELMGLGEAENINELRRFAMIVSENITKGGMLAAKLEAEGEFLWNGRKMRVREFGRIADTKLILPLVMMLLVLIGIVIFPAISTM